jgi:DNA-binding MarR family transcriptional regulator
MATRYSITQRRLLDILRERPSVSIDHLAADLDVDRRTVQTSIRQLEDRGRILRQQGSGRQPNTYEVLP